MMLTASAPRCLAASCFSEDAKRFIGSHCTAPGRKPARNGVDGQPNESAHRAILNDVMLNITSGKKSRQRNVMAIPGRKRFSSILL